MTPSSFEIKLRHNRRSSQLLKVKASKMNGKRWKKMGTSIKQKKMGTSINGKRQKMGTKMGALIN